MSVKEINPLKQGLKHNNIILDADENILVKEINPLKQGLKLDVGAVYYSDRYDEFVKEINPLKQGLKLLYSN